MRTIVLAASFLFGFMACRPSESVPDTVPMSTIQDSSQYHVKLPNKDQLYDRVMGSLVGSAIGDAMGAPTEMWSREERIRSYGYVDDIDPSFIDPSPEGLWDFHLPKGTTTDDTRWKLLVGDYMVDQMASFYKLSGPDPYQFAKYIDLAYQKEVEHLKATESHDPVEIEYHVRRLTWLQEWAQVAAPFAGKDLEAYTAALHRFYGGDLLCAGMLYAPALGLPYPGDPHKAYNAAHRMGIFDQGYARDITGLTAAMVAAAMDQNATPESVMEVFRTVDPHDYFRSRLFGRQAFKTFRSAEHISQLAKDLDECDGENSQPVDSLAKCRLYKAFTLLDQQNQHSPAHAQEILLVTLTAMLYCDFDFQESLEFITNYGRDNDTSGAVAGAVLGAYHGYQKLPDALKELVVKTNRNNLGIDLETLAAEITDQIMSLANNES